MPRLLVVASTFRILDNYIDTLRLLVRSHWDVGLLVLANKLDPDARRLDSTEFSVVGGTVVDGRRPYLTDQMPLRAAARQAVREFKPDALLCTSCSRWPQGVAADLARKCFKAVRIIAAQHGFVQPWDRYAVERWWDNCMIFGERYRSHFPAEAQSELVVAGLPKIERLLDLPVTDGGYLLFAAQDQPTPDDIRPALQELARISGNPVKVRPHPQYPQFYDSLAGEFSILPSGGPYAELLTGATGIVTTGSTVALEAMAIGKPVIILPSNGADFYADSGCVANSLAPAGVRIAYENVIAAPSSVSHFLQSALYQGGRGNVQHCADRLAELVG